MVADTVVRARIDSETKARAEAALRARGLTMSEAIRRMLCAVADGRNAPFDARVPNAATVEAIRELEGGGGERFASVEKLLEEYEV